MDIHHLPVTRTGRYATAGNTHDPDEIWFVFHGYRQLAPRFLTYFQHLDNGRRLLVAPEGQSRFYVDAGTGKVGASWMTKEDREIDIEDYLRFLDAVADEIRSGLADGIDPARIQTTVLGFSQGVATATRWVLERHIKPDRFVVWGDHLPPEYRSAAAVEGLRDTEVFVVRGREDEYITDEVAARHVDAVRALDLEFDYIEFDGGHRLDKNVLARIAGG